MEMEVVDIIEKSETVALNEKVQEIITQDCLGWISNTFPERMSRALPVNSARKAEEAASAQRDLAKVLLLATRMKEGGKDQTQELGKRFFGENGIIEKPKPNITKQDARNFLFGPISICTLVDLLKSSRPDLFDRIDELNILATPEEDVRDAIDVKLDFVETDNKGRRVIKFVQLKSSSQDQIEIYKLHEEDRGKNIYGATPSGIGRILDAVHRVNKEYYDELSAEAYVILVPGYDSRSVSRNPTGIINGHGRQELIDVFKSEGEKKGFLPKKND